MGMCSSYTPNSWYNDDVDYGLGKVDLTVALEYQ
jgi:hypothetical protein